MITDIADRRYQFHWGLLGFIAALLEKFTGKAFLVKEIDCWCTGERTCRFTAEALAVPAVK